MERLSIKKISEYLEMLNDGILEIANKTFLLVNQFHTSLITIKDVYIKMYLKIQNILSTKKQEKNSKYI